MKNSIEDFRILIVDDSTDTIKLLSGILENESYDITYELSGKEALARLRTKRFDLILLDILLPDMSGFDVLEELRKDDELKNIPVIFVSQLNDPKSVIKALKLGGKDYLPKDSTEIEFLASIRTQRELKEKNDMLMKEKEEFEKRLLEIDRENDRINKLLLKVLPPVVAEELKTYEQVKPYHYEKVSVLFTDFKDFSKITKDLTPGQLIKKLSMYFSEFDKIVEKWEVEKIKTIGDAYMCVGGLHRLNQSNPIQTILAGLEIQEFIKYNNTRNKANNEHLWELRIGIHTGDVIAGVVGKSKYSYDIWGDTVNIASRLESKGETGKVNISEATYNEVKEFFECIHRGKIETKHTGTIDMFFVERIKPEYSDDGRIPNKRFKDIIEDLSKSSGF
jgi:class 3 adenylate cyclase